MTCEEATALHRLFLANREVVRAFMTTHFAANSESTETGSICSPLPMDVVLELLQLSLFPGWSFAEEQQQQQQHVLTKNKFYSIWPTGFAPMLDHPNGGSFRLNAAQPVSVVEDAHILKQSTHTKIGQVSFLEPTFPLHSSSYTRQLPRVMYIRFSSPVSDKFATFFGAYITNKADSFVPIQATPTTVALGPDNEVKKGIYEVLIHAGGLSDTPWTWCVNSLEEPSDLYIRFFIYQFQKG
eukprot:PhM_4_TR7010/c0_g1_i1/m.34101